MRECSLYIVCGVIRSTFKRSVSSSAFIFPERNRPFLFFFSSFVVTPVCSSTSRKNRSVVVFVLSILAAFLRVLRARFHSSFLIWISARRWYPLISFEFCARILRSWIAAISSCPSLHKSSAWLYFLIVSLIAASLFGFACSLLIYSDAWFLVGWRFLLITHSLSAETTSPVSK